ncbi:MAG: putative outer membrane protein precursorTonB-dependent [Ramlibacter sp.]|jgi:iron complex outermembrane receptor protein|uniref:TonB-dependent receptor family protein n=1 Tax=Ramlibacter sp. TaxID=1917967 RepID=UPI00262F169B|nr:TonB-dependent receptor [Ramlibacter sp.]MDB5752542.1 putative outer membrane protein precursorTonB-dependent [Ramlibacter sp.]
MRHALLTLAALAAAAQAVAQPAAEEPERTLRPVVVTATPGVAQDAFDTPASVDVIDGATIRRGQLQINLSESLVRVPGVVALNRQNYAQDLQISVRGFGARATFGVRGLRLYADGIPATAPDGQGQISHFDLASADRIEVLRGPFSALYGNSSGGVISMFTADGGPRPVAEVGATIGSDGIRRYNMRLSGEEGPWNYHLSTVRFSTDGYREHSAAERSGFNGKVKYTLSPDTRFTLVVNTLDMPDVQDPLGLTRAEMEANRRQSSPAALTFNTRKSVDQLQAGGIVEHRIDPVHSVKLTAWRGRRGTEQFQAIPVFVQAPPTQPGGVISLGRDYQGLDAQWVGKTRLLDRPFTLTAGLTADQLQESRRGYQNFRGTTLGVMGPLRRDEENRVRSFDQYLQGQWTTGRVSVTGGVRHSRIAFGSRDRFIAPGNGDDSGSARFDATTPALGVVFHASDHLNLYASAGKGFETPTFNELSYRPGGAPGLNFGLDSADSRQWELGVKAEPIENWRVNVALFQARTTGEIVVLSNTGGRSSFQNAGETRRRGLETALAGGWGKGWSLHAAATWLDATYASGFLTCGPPPCFAPTTPVAAGSRIPGIPRTTAFVELGWAHRPWGLETALEYRHQGRMATDDQNRDFAPAANLWNLRVSLAQPLGRWTLREFVRVDNLANRRYVGSVIVNEGNQRYFEPAPGRTWLVGVNAAYAF